MTREHRQNAIQCLNDEEGVEYEEREYEYHRNEIFHWRDLYHHVLLCSK